MLCIALRFEYIVFSEKHSIPSFDINPNSPRYYYL